MGALGTPELLIILAVVILLFGARKLPELSRSVGQSIQEFRKASKESESDESSDTSTEA